MADVALRRVEDTDLDALFDQMRDPESVRMAAFTHKDPDDRADFDAHTARIRAWPDVVQRVVTLDGRLVGSISSFVIEGDTESPYWIDRSVWGQGIASRAVALLLELVPERPLYARAASTGSLGVLRKAGSRSSAPRCPTPRLGAPRSRRNYSPRLAHRQSSRRSWSSSHDTPSSVQVTP